MKLLYRTKDLWMIFGEFCAVLPLFLLNFAIYYKVPLTKFFVWESMRPFLFVFGIFLLWFIITSVLILKGKWAGFFSFFIYSGSCLYINTYLLVKFKNYGLAFYAMAYLVFCVYLLFNMHALFRTSYLNPGRRWYEGTPRFLPQVEVDVEGLKNLRLSALDLRGCFLFGEDCAEILRKEALQQSELLLKLTLKNVTLELPMKIISQTVEAQGVGQGVGVAFSLNSFDLQKHLRDFILRLRSHGYIQEFLL